MWLNLKKNHLQFGALLLALSSILSRGLGVLRDLVFTSIFGVGAKGGDFALDAYFLAFKIPDFLYTLLIFGALSSAFIPLYVEAKKEDGEKSAHLFASQVLTGLMGLMLLFSGLAFGLAPFIIKGLAPGFTPELQTLALTLTRIMLLSPIFMGLSGILQGVENANKAFLGTALAPLVYNGSIIFAAYFFGAEHGVYALAYGVVCGALLHFLIQIPGVLKCGFKFSLTFKPRAARWIEFLRLSLPRIFSSSAQQLASFVDVMLATLLTLGSLSIYTYAFNLQSLPYGVVAVAVSTAMYASLAEQASDKSAFFSTLRNSLIQILYWALPAILGLFLLRTPIIEFFFERGAFDAQATQKTAEVLAVFVWSALPQSLIPLFTRGVYALKKTKTPVLCALAGIALTLSFNLVAVLYYHEGIVALAYGNLLGGSLNALLLYFLMSQELKVSFTSFLNSKKLGFIVLGLLGMGASLVWMESFPIGVSIPLAAAIYLVLSRVGRPITK